MATNITNHSPLTMCCSNSNKVNNMTNQICSMFAIYPFVTNTGMNVKKKRKYIITIFQTSMSVIPIACVFMVHVLIALDRTTAAAMPIIMGPSATYVSLCFFLHASLF